MRSPFLPLVLIAAGGFSAVFVLRISLNRWLAFQSPPGCTPQTADGQTDSTATVAFWSGSAVPAYIGSVPLLSDSEKKVLGTTSDDKWIEIDLARQLLIAHQSDQVILQSPISSGLWNPTPKGEYRIWYKIVSTKMEGGSKLNGSYYYLPNVPFAMFFQGNYGIHGTYWHNDFGRPRSHGCINAPTSVAEKLFFWADPQLPSGRKTVRSTAENLGTRVIIHD